MKKLLGVGLLILGCFSIAATTERNHLPTFFGVIFAITGLIVLWAEIETMLLERRKTKSATIASDR